MRRRAAGRLHAVTLFFALLVGVLLVAGAHAQSSAPVVIARTPDDAGVTMLPGVINRMTIAIDAAHGGADSGARIGEAGRSAMQEKDVTLALALRLQAVMAARGFTVVMTRTSDTADKLNAPGTAMTLDDRAGVANHARGAACLLLHAAESGHGVHIYSSELDGVPAEAALLPWATAQAAWVVTSSQLGKQIGEALRRAGVPRVVSRATVRPMDSLTCPAVVVELAPESEDVHSVGDGAYQQRVAEALASGLEIWSKQVQPPPLIPRPAPKPKPVPIKLAPPTQTPEAQP